MTEPSTDTPDLDPAGFDLDGWLDGVKRPQAVVTLYARQDLDPQINSIVAELEPLVTKMGDKDNYKGDTLSGPDATRAADQNRCDELKQQLRNLWAQYEASGVDFELTQLSSDEYDRIVDEVEGKHPEPAFDAPDVERVRVATERNALNAQLMTLRSVTAAGPTGQPRTPLTLTAETLVKLEKQFGVRQMSDLFGQVRALTLAEIGVDVPFSQRVSQALGESTSEKS